MGWTLPKNPRSQLKIRVSNVEIQNIAIALRKKYTIREFHKVTKISETPYTYLRKILDPKFKKEHYPSHYYYFRNTKSVRLELNSKDMTLELAWGSQI